MQERPLTKSQLAGRIAEETGVSKKDAATLIDSITSIACEEVKSKGEFTLPGLGKLVLDDRKARMGRNPATGEVISIPAKKVVKFRVSKSCKDSVLG